MLFTVEGNIGAGKSTLLKKLETTEFAIPHVILYEPIDDWLNVKPEGPNSTSLFEKYYNDKRRYGFMFQMYALQTRVNHMLKTLEENPDKIIICERTHFTDSEIFAKMLYKENIMDKTEYYVYKSWYDDCNARLTGIVKGAIYLRADPPTCMTRIAKRNRDGEDNISVHYIKTLHDLHEEWLLPQLPSQPQLPVCTIDGNVDESQVDITSIINFVNSQIIA